MAKTVFNHVKFKQGRWQMGRNVFGERCIRVKNEVFCKFFPGLKETEETARLIASAPKMFWILVTRAEETGEQYLFDVLSGIIGHKITYEEMCELAEQAHQILQRWHKEEQAEAAEKAKKEGKFYCAYYNMGTHKERCQEQCQGCRNIEKEAKK